MPTTKSKSVPKTSKTKVTVLLNREIFSEFSSRVKELGMRRDTYLNQVLPGELAPLADVPAGTAKGEEVAKLLRTMQKDLVRAGFTLDADVTKAMTTLCADKRVLRDQFIEECLGHLSGVLDMAAVLITSPWSHGEPIAYEKLAWNDEMVAQFHEKLLGAEASTDRKSLP